MSAELADEVLRWLAARPRLFQDDPPVDLTHCGGCGRPAIPEPINGTSPRGGVLVVLSAPGGAYALCRRCYASQKQASPLQRAASRRSSPR